MYCMDSLECHAKVYKHFKHAQSNHCDSAFYSRNAVEIEKNTSLAGSESNIVTIQCTEVTHFLSRTV